jgi:hypothetical protein
MYNELIAHRRELANAKDALEAAQQETRAILSEFSRRSINPIVGEKPTTTELKKTVLEYLAEIPSNPTENAGLSARDARLLRLRLDLALRFTKQTHKATMSSTPTKVKERLRRTVASSSAAHSVALESFRSPVSEEEFNIDGWT